MSKKRERGLAESGTVEIRSLEDLINLNLKTLAGVVNETIDNKKAALIFTGSRTVTGSLKIGIEALKLGFGQINGLDMGKADRVSLPNSDSN